MIPRIDATLNFASEGVQMRGKNPIRGDRNTQVNKRERALINTQDAGD